LYLDRKPRDAAAAVPRDFIDATSLIGPIERIRDRMHGYAAAGVATLTVAVHAPALADRIATLRALASALEASGLSS
ncbi:MAG TPA: LLM class F420-dependent oxidoreductase, partial [Kineosporiaceae bacterium]|nr:LLM class F420-dependent oxidoreductase [Kineosporiaceae bacterium]